MAKTLTAEQKEKKRAYCREYMRWRRAIGRRTDSPLTDKEKRKRRERYRLRVGPPTTRRGRPRID